MSATTLYDRMASPLGELLLAGDETALHELWMQDPGDPRRPEPAWRAARAPFAAARAQLEEYFDGRRTTFDLALAPRGTAFQQRVWAELRRLRYGTTIGYGALAARLGAPGAARAVGLANGRNPIPVIVPCHRVVGADGSLTGFGGGLVRKRMLLDLEAGRTALL